MFKKFFTVVTLCFMFMASSSAVALDAVTKNALDKKFSAMIGSDGIKVPGLGVIVYKDGNETYSCFIGHRRLNPEKKLTRQTLFRVASLSKMFTIFSLMQLVEQGKINLNDDASNYLDFKLRNPNFPDTPITVEMLASHTSSLRDGKIYALPPQYTLKDFFMADGFAYGRGSHFAKEKSKAPGKYFRYCNLNYGVLGTIIERVTGERFDLYQKNHILKQLNISGGYVVANLDKNSFENLGTLYKNNVAQIDDYKTQPRRDYVTVQNPYVPKAFGAYDMSDYKIGTNATIFSPQGGLRISFDDLSKCLEMLLNRGIYNGTRIIGEKSFDEMISSHWTFDAANPNGNTFGGVMENYGLGTYKIGGTSKARLCKDFEIDFIGHSGEAFGLISGLYFFPATKDGVLFMINGTAIEPGEDKRSFGKFSANFIWEENVMNLICEYIFDK